LSENKNKSSTSDKEWTTDVSDMSEALELVNQLKDYYNLHTVSTRISFDNKQYKQFRESLISTKEAMDTWCKIIKEYKKELIIIDESPIARFEDILDEEE
jgi:hypothetical protein